MTNRSVTWLNAKVFANFLNVSIWIAFLALLALMSFSTQGYKSSQWLQISSGVYCLASLALFSFLIGGQGNIASLRQAKVSLCLLLLIIAWQVVQIYPGFGFSNGFNQKVFSAAALESWFVPPQSISIVPQASKWLIWSNFFELVLFGLAIFLIDTSKRLKQLLFLFGVVGLVHASFALAAKFGNVFLVDIAQLDGHYKAARGFFVNRNHLAGFCGLTLVGSLAILFKGIISDRALNSKQRLLAQPSTLRVLAWRVLAWLVLLIVLAVILLSQSRAGFLGLLLGPLTVFFILKPSNIGWKSAAKYGVLALIIGSGLLWYFGQDMLVRLSPDQFSLGERAEQWAITWDAIKHQLWVGYGGGSYTIVFQAWRGYADLRYVIYDQSHNHYLHLWLEQGLIGLLLWLGFLFSSFTKTIKSYQIAKSTLVKAVLAASLVVLAAALYQSLVDYNLQIMNMRSYFFVIIAVCFAAPNIKRKKRTQRSRSKKHYSQHSFLTDSESV